MKYSILNWLKGSSLLDKGEFTIPMDKMQDDQMIH